MGKISFIEATMLNPASLDEFRQALSRQKHCIARGLGRSYGDSALANEMISLRRMDILLRLMQKTGSYPVKQALVCQIS
ncbi:MAG: hypothetical protein LRY43_03430 [Gammaproteobacteria bacterium]|nr:hypothetical protein [Gammaproteobacteria bacterium]